jgi:hypothetical protein
MRSPAPVPSLGRHRQKYLPVSFPPPHPFSFWPLVLKGRCHTHEIFCFRFFSWIIFPHAPENNTRVVSNFFQSSRRYWQVKEHHRYQRQRWQICHWCQWHRTVDALWAANISANFRKKSKRPSNGMLRGLRETDSWKNLKPTSLRRLAQRKLQGTIKCKNEKTFLVGSYSIFLLWMDAFLYPFLASCAF